MRVTSTALTVLALSSAVLGGSGAAIAGATPSAAAPLAGSAPAYTWPEAHQNPSLTGKVADPSISTANAATLGVRWMTFMGTEALSSPVVAWNAALSKTLVFSANEAGLLVAYDQATGLPLWSRQMGSAIRSTPLAEGSALWVAPSHGGRLYKLDAATGATECSAPVSGLGHGTLDASPTTGTPPGGSPTVYMGANDQGKNNGPVTGVDEATCAVDFQVSSEPKAGTGGIWDFLSYGVSATGEGLVLYGTADPDSSVYANDAVTGKLVWRYQALNPPPGSYDVGAGVTVSAPGVNGFADGVAYVESKYGVMYALNLTTGALIWSYDFGHPSLSTAALSGTNLVFGSETSGVYDLDAVTGALVWRYQDPNGIDASPAIIGPAGKQVVAFGDYGGDIDVLSLAAGSLLYQLPTGSYIVGSPAETDGNLVAVSGDGFLYDLTPGGGTAATPSTAVTSPANSSTVPNPGGDLMVSGTAAATGGLSAVQVDVRRSDGSWWDGATGTWTAGPYPNPATLADPGGSTSTWTATFPAATGGDTYEAFASAVSGGVADNSVGLSSPTAARSSFTVSPATSAPTLSVSSTWVAPGAKVGLSGGGFAAGETVDLAFGATELKPITATKTGALPATQLGIPGAAVFGPTALVATGATSGRSTSAPLYVTNSWTQFGGSPLQQAYDPLDDVFTEHLSVSSSTYLTQAWSFTTGGPIAGSVDVADGTAYVADESGSVYAVSLADAMQLWKHTVPAAEVTTTPALTSTGTLIVDTTAGKVVALSQSTGRPAWSVSLAGTPGSPTVAGATVYIGSSTGTLTALNAQTGSTTWTATLPGAVSSSPAVDLARNLVIVGDASGRLSALAATSGSVVWTKTVAGAIDGSPVVAGGAVYVGSADHSAYSFAETTGAPNWSYNTGGAVTIAPAIINGDVAVGSSSGTVSYLVPATGGVRFTVKEGSPVAGLAGAGNFLVATDTDGDVHGSKPGSSDPNAWLATQGTSLSAAPTVVNGEVFVPGLNGRLAVFTVPGSPVS